MTRLSLGMKCVSFLIISTNVIFLLLAIVLIAIGGVVFSVFRNFEKFMEAHHFSPATLVVSIGIIMFLIAFFGCCGAVKHSTCMINMYTLMLILLLIVEIGAVITAFVIRCDINDTLESNMKTLMGEYSKNKYSKKSWDVLQQELHCCGIEKPTDWASVSIENGVPVFVDGKLFYIPHSCCVEPKTCGNKLLYSDGCLKKLYLDISKYATAIGIAALIIACVQLLGVIFSCTLAKSIRRNKTLEELERQQEQRIRNMQHATRIRTNATVDSSES